MNQFCIADSCLVVMFHYIQGSTRKLGPKGISQEVFKAQVEYLAREYEIIEPQRYHGYLSGQEKSLPQKSCLLTFDDGLREHVEVVAPLLEAEGASGIFFVSGMPVAGRKPINVHLVHILRSSLGDDLFAGAFVETLRKNHSSTYELYAQMKLPQEIENIYRYDDATMQRVKYFITYLVDGKILDKALRHMLHGDLTPDEILSGRFYASENELRELIGQGMVLGNHSWSHRLLSRLSALAQKREIRKNQAWLENLGCRERLFSFPYGKLSSFSGTTLEILRSDSYSAAYTSERAINVGKKDPLLIFRIDTNELRET